MQDLSTYITEKLKLSDINKDKLYDAEWVDARKLKLKDLKEGDIIELKNGKLFVVIPTYLFIELRKHCNPDTVYDYVFGNIGYFGADGIDYIAFESYQNNYPVAGDKIDNFTIKRVYKRNKKYINSDEVYKDLYAICIHNKIN